MTQQKTPNNSPGKNLGNEKENQPRNQQNLHPDQRRENEERTPGDEKRTERTGTDNRKQEIRNEEKRPGIKPGTEPEIDPQRINTPQDPNKIEENPDRQREREKDPRRDNK